MINSINSIVQEGYRAPDPNSSATSAPQSSSTTAPPGQTGSTAAPPVAPPPPVSPAPTQGLARESLAKDYKSYINHPYSHISSFRDIPRFLTNFYFKMMPGGVGSYKVGQDSITTNSRYQFQDNPIMHAGFAQMMIEINKLDNLLTPPLQNGAPAVPIAQTAAQTSAAIAPAVQQAVESGIKTLITERAGTLPPQMAQNIGDILIDTSAVQSLQAGLQREATLPGLGYEHKGATAPQLGFEKKNDGTLNFHGNCTPQNQPQVAHDQENGFARAFSWLAELLLILLANVTKFRSEAVFDNTAKIYAAKLQELITKSPEHKEQAVQYINDNLLSPTSPLDPAIAQALKQALGIAAVTGAIKADDIVIDPKGMMTIQGKPVEKLNARQIDESFRQDYASKNRGGDGSVSLKIAGTEEQLEAVRQMNKHSDRQVVQQSAAAVSNNRAASFTNSAFSSTHQQTGPSFTVGG